MNKLQRYKKDSKKTLSMLFYDRFVNFNFDVAPQDWEWYRKWNKKINTLKRVPQQQYITNTVDVCNID